MSHRFHSSILVFLLRVCLVFLFLSQISQSLWLIRPITYVWPQIVPALGMIRPCGATQIMLDNAILSIVTHGMTFHRSGNLAEC